MTPPDHNPASRPAGAAGAPPDRGSVFRLVWRWHFYAGAVVGPVIVVLAVTGGLYVFKDEINRARNAGVAYVTPAAERTTIAAQVRAAEASLPPGYRATGLEVSDAADRSTVVVCSAPKQPARRVGVDPYTARALGPFADDTFFPAVLDLHRRLMLGETGRVVVELGTSWTIVLLVTGAYLWWPRRREKVRGVVTPRLGAARYTVLRDLHALAGAYALPVVFVIAATGLMYTLVWGSGYRYAGKTTGAFAFFADPPKSAGARGPARYPVDAAVAEAVRRYPGHPLSLTLPRGADGSYVFFVRGHSGPVTNALLVIHRDDGTVLLDEPASGFPPVSQWATWNYSLHVGSAGGTATKVVWLLACVVLGGLPVTGAWMWWQRRPRGRTGLPRRPAVRAPAWVIAAAVGLGVVLPTVGASLAVILAAEWVAGRVGRAWKNRSSGRREVNEKKPVPVGQGESCD